MKTHHWRWRTPKYLLLCGAKNGMINQHDESDITCKRCLSIMNKRHKENPNAGWLRGTMAIPPSGKVDTLLISERDLKEYNRLVNK